MTEENYKKASPINYISEKTPPVFIWHTQADDLVFVDNSLNFAIELKKYKVPFEMHIFENGSHGLALADWRTGNAEHLFDEDVKKWEGLALRFLERHFE